MKEIGVIGATSSLGLHLVPLLAAKGYRVFASFRDVSRIPAAWFENDSIVPLQLELSGDSDFADFRRDAVVWLAHLNQGRFNEHEAEVNLAPFARFLEDCSKTRKFVFVSSGGSVYGKHVRLPIDEDHPRDPLSSYGRAKRAMEDKLANSKIATAIIRPGNIYGFETKKRPGKGIIATFLSAIETGATFTRMHEGRTTRDFVHVDDVSRAVLAAVESENTKIVWNVATGKGTTAAEVVEMVLAKSGFAAPKIVDIENPASDVDENILSIDRIVAESNWRPEITLEKGVEMVIANWNKG